jgi:hypothetical protein
VPGRPLPLQRTLQIGRTDDPLEHEADRVAREVLRMPAPARRDGRCACGGSPGPDGECPACKAERLGLRRSPARQPEGIDAPPIVHEVLASRGRPLDPQSRAYFEPRLGLDLGDVRVHDGGRAARSAEAVNALAYTVGRDVVFAQHEHAPQTSAGRALLAHELAHVAQGRRGAGSSTVRRAPPETPTLEQRVSTLELVGDWRSKFGARMAVYRGGVWLLVGAFRDALKHFNGALGRDAQEAAVMDQVGAAILSLGAAGLAEPLLTAHLGLLSSKLDDLVEFFENPVITAAQGATSVGVAGLALERARGAPAPTLPAPSGRQEPGGAQDPLDLLSDNMVLLEDYTRRIEEGLGDASASVTNEGLQALYDELGSVALTSVDQLKDAAALSLTIERHFWAAWIRAFPPFKGLFWGREISRRMKDVGLEELAHVGFDTESLIFQNPEPSPEAFEGHLRLWAAGFAETLTR